jgi:hypothetical protein
VGRGGITLPDHNMVHGVARAHSLTSTEIIQQVHVVGYAAGRNLRFYTDRQKENLSSWMSKVFSVFMEPVTVFTKTRRNIVPSQCSGLFTSSQTFALKYTLIL